LFSFICFLHFFISSSPQWRLNCVYIYTCPSPPVVILVGLNSSPARYTWKANLFIKLPSPRPKTHYCRKNEIISIPFLLHPSQTPSQITLGLDDSPALDRPPSNEPPMLIDLARQGDIIADLGAGRTCEYNLGQVGLDADDTAAC